DVFELGEVDEQPPAWFVQGARQLFGETRRCRAVEASPDRHDPDVALTGLADVHASPFPRCLAPDLARSGRAKYVVVLGDRNRLTIFSVLAHPAFHNGARARTADFEM